MNSLIATDIFNTLKSENVKEQLESILQLMDELVKHRFEIKKNNEIWEFRVSEEFFYDWLYSKNPPELVDLKKEFYLRMDKAVDIDSEEYENFVAILNNVANNNSDYHDYQNQFLFINYDKSDEIHILSSLSKFYHLRRWYLEKCVNQKKFVEVLPLLFPNLYFHKDLLTTLRTLNNDFNKILPEIVLHLTKLESFHQSGKLNFDESNIVKCKKFEEFSNISCSPESSRNKANKLTFQSSTDEKINCECHTKFNKFGKESEKQDRIYFSFGLENFVDGKIIIYHIGDHI